MYLGKIEPQKSYKGIIIAVIMVAVLLAIAVIYLSFSRANIEIIPKKEKVLGEFKIQLDQNEEPDFRRPDKITGRVLTQEDEKTEKITGVAEKEIPERAHGKIRIVNNQSKPQTLVTQTRFLSENGIQFRIQKWVSVPPHGSIEEEVIADEPGEQGNIESSKFTIPGLSTYLQQIVYGESIEPITGGTRKATVLTEEDINNARDKVAEKLYEVALKDLKNKLQGSESFNENSVKKEIIEVSSSVDVGTETSEFDIDVKVKVTTPVFDREKMLEICRSKLEEKIPEDKELTSINENSLKYNIENLNPEKNEALLKIHIEGETINKMSSDIFDKSKIIGMDKKELEEYFKQNPEVENIKVKLWPFWIKTVPSLKDHIIIEVKSH